MFIQKLHPFLFALAASYPIFWLQTFSPTRSLRVYTTIDLNSPSDLVFDEPPSFFALGALLWASVVATVTSFGPGRCMMQEDAPIIGFLWGLLAIAACAKCLLGSLAEVHKRVVLTCDRKLIRPATWKMFDLLTALPVTATNKLAQKFFWFAVFAGIVHLLDALGAHWTNEHFIVPTSAFLASTLLFFGRLSAIHVHRNVQPFHVSLGIEHRTEWSGAVRAAIVVWCTVSFFVTYFLLEKVLQGCGIAPGALPSMTAILLGVLAAPTLSLAATAIGIFAASLLGNSR